MRGCKHVCEGVCGHWTCIYTHFYGRGNFIAAKIGRMVKPRKFKIILRDWKRMYSPGDDVTGHLELQLDKEMAMKEVHVEFAGKAFVSWNEGKHNYSETEEFFSETTIVHGQDSSATSDRVSLPAGDHIFNFQFQLPPLLASSYEDKMGYIRYYLKARIVKPWRIDIKTTHFLEVWNTINLNQLNNMMLPIGGEGSKSLCCCCCASGAIEGNVHINRRGFVPGEKIVVNATVENHSSSKVRHTSIEFVKIVTYATRKRQNTVVKSLAKEMGPSCKPRDSLNLNNVELRVPSVRPTGTRHCNVLRIHYAVMLETYLRRCAINLRVFAPLLVGTIPLAGMVGDNSATGEAKQTPTTQNATGALPPPYAVATSSGFDNPLNRTDKPTSTYYDWNQSAFTYS